MTTKTLILLLKAHVKGYTRRTKSGGSAFVKEHDDSRQKQMVLFSSKEPAKKEQSGMDFKEYDRQFRQHLSGRLIGSAADAHEIADRRADEVKELHRKGVDPIAAAKHIHENPHTPQRGAEQKAAIEAKRAAHDKGKPKGFKTGDRVKYSTANDGEKDMRFEVKESHHDANPPRVHIWPADWDYKKQGPLRPIETVHPADLELADDKASGAQKMSRLDWEEQLYQAIEKEGFDRSDAQGVVEGQEMQGYDLDEQHGAGRAPAEVAKEILEKATPKKK